MAGRSGPVWAAAGGSVVGAQVLARFGNKEPAIVEHPFGLGRVVLIASALHADATQLPLRVGFLPLMQCLSLHLLSPGKNDALKVGEHVTAVREYLASRR